MRKKLLSIGLLCCLITPVIITAGLYAWQKYTTRQEVKRKLALTVPRESLVLLRFATHQLQTELRWEHAGEFEYRNQMYDVVYREQQDDSTLFWCWWDHTESQLNKVLNALVAHAVGQNDHAQKRAERLNIFFKSLFFQQADVLCFSLRLPAFCLPFVPQASLSLSGFVDGLEQPPDAIV